MKKTFLTIGLTLIVFVGFTQIGMWKDIYTTNLYPMSGGSMRVTDDIVVDSTLKINFIQTVDSMVYMAMLRYDDSTISIIKYPDFIDSLKVIFDTTYVSSDSSVFKRVGNYIYPKGGDSDSLYMGDDTSVPGAKLDINGSFISRGPGRFDDSFGGGGDTNYIFNNLKVGYNGISPVDPQPVFYTDVGNFYLMDTFFIKNLQPMPAGAPYGRFLMQDKGTEGVYYTSLSALVDTIYVYLIDSTSLDTTLWALNGSTIYNKDQGSTFVGINTTTANEELDVNGDINMPVSTATEGVLRMGTNHMLSAPGYYSTYLGFGAGNMNDNYNTGIGYLALRDITGFYNISVGYNAGYKATSANNNSFIGYRAGYDVETGDYNTFVGGQAGGDSPDINRSTAIGYTAMGATDYAEYSIAVGNNAGPYEYGSNSVAIGNESGAADSLSRTVSIGDNTHWSHQGTLINAVAVGYRANYYGSDNGISIGYQAHFHGGDGADSNIVIGHQSYFNPQFSTNSYHYSGNSNLALGNDIKPGAVALSNFSEDHKLYIGNWYGSNEYSLIEGDMEDDSLEFNATTTIRDDLTVMDSIRWTNHIAQFHRIDSIDVSTAGSWVDVKFDTLIANETTYGYEFNSDSTGFLVNFDGDTRVQGCGHWIWRGSNGSTERIYIRVTVGGVEARCAQANDTRGSATSDDGTLAFTGTIHHTTGQEVKVQYRVSDASMDFEGSSVFDNPVAFSVNFEKINNDL